MALSQKQITVVYESVRDVASNYLGPELSVPSDLFFIREEHDGSDLEMTIEREADAGDLANAAFQYEISEPFEDTSRPELDCSLVRSYAIGAYVVERKLLVYKYAGSSFSRETIAGQERRFPRVPVKDANAMRHLNSGLLNYEKIMEDIELAHRAFAGKSFKDEASRNG